jgi:hypothetical protein
VAEAVNPAASKAPVRKAAAKKTTKGTRSNPATAGSHRKGKSG